MTRIDGMWQAISKVGDSFCLDEIRYPYVEASYQADTWLRPDNPRSFFPFPLRFALGLILGNHGVDKVQGLLEGSKQDYDQLFGYLAREFIDKGIIEPDSNSGRYSKNYTLAEKDIEFWLKECSGVAWGISVKNWTTSGIPEGVVYYLAKRRRIVLAALRLPTFRGTGG